MDCCKVELWRARQRGWQRNGRTQFTIGRLVRCGGPRYGLSLLHCPDYNLHAAVPYSCKTRVCPSCVNRRAEVLAHALTYEHNRKSKC